MQSVSNVGENDNFLDRICDKYYIEFFFVSFSLCMQQEVSQHFMFEEQLLCMNIS